MKESQWVAAALVLAALVFIVVFATQYLGTPAHRTTDTPIVKPELTFPDRSLPYVPGPDGEPLPAPQEYEEKARAVQDFFFINANEEPVKVGLDRTSCQCSAVEVYLLPGPGAVWMGKLAAGLLAMGQAGPVAASASYAVHLGRAVESAANAAELRSKAESAEVPAGAAGWVRLRFNSDKPGPKGITATLWFNSTDGKIATLRTAAMFHEPIRARSSLNLDTLSRDDLEKGVERELFVWSSTRESFSVTVEVAGGPASDGMQAGKPTRLSREELRALDEANLASPPGEGPTGRARSAWRIPLLVKAVGPDGKTPFEIGRFRRRIIIRCPEVEGPSGTQVVEVGGRVQGLIEVGAEDSGQLALGPFRRVDGKTAMLPLSTSEPDIKLSLDRARSASFLRVTLPEAPDVGGGRLSWLVKVEVPPETASGQFPRLGDPQYEDSALYFRVEAKGKAYTVRVPISGTATE
jgi:hypothetical protein